MVETEVSQQVKEDKEFKLPFQKTKNSATGKQVKFLEKLTSGKNVSTSQLAKRLGFNQASELIDLAKQGYEFSIIE